MKLQLVFMIISLLLKDVDCETVEVFAEVGSEAILPCKSTPQTVSPAVTWRNSNGSVWRMQRSGLRFWSASWAPRVRCPHTQFHNGDYSLHIQSVTEEDAGSFFCTLELDNVRRPLMTQVTLRIVQVMILPAAPMIGQSVMIRCSVSDGNRPSAGLSETRTRWMLNGSPYEAEETFSSRTDRALKIKASERLRGNWTCVISSTGREGTASALMHVKGIIRPPSDGAQIFAAVGSAVTLPCVFSDELTPSNALWERLKNKTTSRPSRGNLPPSFSPPSPLVSSRDKSAGLNEVQFEDAGRYRCSASAQGQRIERNMQLVTAKVEVEVSSKEDASVKLTCRLSDSSSVTGYEWIYVTFDLNGTEFTASVQNGQTVTVSQTSEGLWTCRFYGRRQELLGNVTHHIHLMEGQREDSVVRGTHGAALLLVGLILLILILVIVLSQMYKNQQRNKMVLPFPALETILHNNSVEREMRERRQTQK